MGEVDWKLLNGIVLRHQEAILVGFRDGAEAFGVPPEQLVVMVADVTTQLGRQFADETGVPGPHVVNVMAIEQWRPFLEEFVEAERRNEIFAAMASPPANTWALIFIVPGAGGTEQIVFAFCEPKSFEFTAPGGSA